MSELNQSIMPLVEENRKLHDEVRVLKHLLAEQNVRVDQVVASGPKYAIRSLRVEVPQRSFLYTQAESRDVLVRGLAEKMVSEIPYIAQRVQIPTIAGDVEYQFAFLSVHK